MIFFPRFYIVARSPDRRFDDTACLRAAKVDSIADSGVQTVGQTIANKDAELVETHQLNRQLQSRIRELEKSLETDDLPWKKPKRTRSLRKSSGRQVGGQPGHPGVTLQAVTQADRIIVHTIDHCQQCGVSLASIEPTHFFRRQVSEIENGVLVRSAICGC